MILQDSSDIIIQWDGRYGVLRDDTTVLHSPILYCTVQSSSQFVYYL